MIGKINKKILLLAVVALLALSSAYILIKPAEQAKADSTYSETWVINEEWQYSSLCIGGSIQYTVAGLDTTFDSFYIENGAAGGFPYVGVSTMSSFSVYKDNAYKYYSTPTTPVDTTNVVSYDTWKNGLGRITFLADTSAAEYSELRTWFEANATRVGCNVTFKYGATVFKTVSVSNGVKASTIDLTGVSPQKAKYVFKGWSKTMGGSIVNLANETITADTTYYAVFELSAAETCYETWVIKENWQCPSKDLSLSGIQYTAIGAYEIYSSFTVGTSGGPCPIIGSGMYASLSVYKDNAYKYYSIPTNPNDTTNVVPYDTWKNGLGKITFFADTSATEYSALRTWLEVNATRIGFTVTFKNGTDTVKTTMVNENSKASAIDLTGVSPEKTGYTFKGWSKTNGGSMVNLANETITADTTYYAVFEINKYSITFNDGTSVLKTVTANYGTKASEINVSTLAPEKEGYTFKGWSKTNGGEVVDLSTVTINQSMAFFAVYEKQTFEIKFMDGETLLKTVTVDYGTNLSAISLTGVSTDKTGFTFRGWALSNGGTVVNSETYSVKSAVNFYAVYDVEGKATVVFKNGATSLKTVTVDLGAKASEIDLSDLELEKNGYTFKGWARSENGIIVDLETVSVNEYTILYAVYEKNSTNTNLSSDNVAKIFGVVGLIALGAVLGGVLFKKRR